MRYLVIPERGGEGREARLPHAHFPYCPTATTIDVPGEASHRFVRFSIFKHIQTSTTSCALLQRTLPGTDLRAGVSARFHEVNFRKRAGCARGQCAEKPLMRRPTPSRETRPLLFLLAAQHTPPSSSCHPHFGLRLIFANLTGKQLPFIVVSNCFSLKRSQNCFFIHV